MRKQGFFTSIGAMHSHEFIVGMDCAEGSTRCFLNGQSFSSNLHFLQGGPHGVDDAGPQSDWAEVVTSVCPEPRGIVGDALQTVG